MVWIEHLIELSQAGLIPNLLGKNSEMRQNSGETSPENSQKGGAQQEEPVETAGVEPDGDARDSRIKL